VTASQPATSTVRISFSPNAAYVRTVRMVAVTVARRAGVAAETLDEVRLAIGEACTRAIGVHRREGRLEPIEVAMALVSASADARSASGSRSAQRRRRASGAVEPGRFTVRVMDRGSPEVARKEQAGGAGAIVARATVAASGDDTGRNALDEELLALGVGLALLGGLVADFSVDDAPDSAGTQVRMSWPVTGARAWLGSDRTAAFRRRDRARRGRG
jgi:anti-sigma regulatory factor (Ser/Thr protein kinase)